MKMRMVEIVLRSRFATWVDICKTTTMYLYGDLSPVVVTMDARRVYFYIGCDLLYRFE